MRRRNYYLSLILATLATSAAAAELTVERIGPEHGLAHNAVNALLEDQEGFLWLGTQDGLQRFDGVDFETFRADGSELGLSHSNITALLEAPDGSLWIGTTAGLDDLSGVFGQRFMPGIFADDFESGDTSQWSTTVP